ncbi:MAG TPA: hypothetical protein VD905_05285 [Flavobacteriales bacterium]|nr:hypothetical protein [Flavobacteriales bacterium]
MNLIDFIIGATLINAMPHFILGIWKGRMLNLFGFGHTGNILYGILNFIISISLFLYTYGFDGIKTNGMYAGAVCVMIAFFAVGPVWYRVFHKNYYEKNKL